MSNSPRQNRRKKLGSLLVDHMVVNDVSLDKALTNQKSWNTSLGQSLFGTCRVNLRLFYWTLASHLRVEFVDLMTCPPDPSLLKQELRHQYLKNSCIPLRMNGEKIVLATSDPSEQFFSWAQETYPGGFQYVVTSHYDILWQNQALFEDSDSICAREALWQARPHFSAKFLFTAAQKHVIYAGAALLAICFALRPVFTAMLLHFGIQLFYFATFFLRVALTAGGIFSRKARIPQQEIDALEEKDLPVFTILVPMFKESDVIAVLAEGIRRLDYPRSKLDVKLVLEADDTGTIEAAKALQLEPIFEIIRVPPSQPRTKPKACNYAMRFARGELVTIYDAEDQPEPQQLKMAVAAFKRLGPEYACVQARLNFFNKDENWLARMFTLEYTHWFDILLPGLHALDLPIPLGGTSNHFKTKILQELGSWDPYNVTEDADLGVRINQNGYKVGIIESTTWEEATLDVGAWIKQRTRWNKGYMQTHVVHMRRPLALFKSLGIKGFLGFQLFVGGPNFVNMMNPVMLFITLSSWFFPQDLLDEFFPETVRQIAIFNLLIGNSLTMFFGVLGAIRRGHPKLALWGLTYPFYWALHSVSSYRALYQLFVAPHLWEKTDHGRTKQHINNITSPTLHVPTQSPVEETRKSA